MSKNDGGGPAFPFTPNQQVRLADGTWDQNTETGEPGMSLRDWFAGMALSGIIRDQIVSTNLEYDTQQLVSGVSEAVYQIADAMLAEREGT